MPDDAEIDLAHRPWPPAFSDEFVRRTRARLDEAGVLVIAGALDGSRDRLAADVAGLVDHPSISRHVSRQGDDNRVYFALDQLWRGYPPPVGADVDAVVTLMRRQLAERDSPPCIVLADAELCDPQSIEVLVRLAETDDLRLVATIGAEALSTQARLRDAGDLLEVSPMDAASVAERLEARFGAPADRAVTELVLARTGGSYEFVQRFVDASVASGLFDVRDGVLSMGAATSPDGSVTSVEADGPGGDPLSADLLDVTSLLGVVDADEARIRFGSPEVDRAVGRGVLSIADGDLAFVFPVEATAIRRSLTRERQVELFDQCSPGLTRTVSRPGVAPRAADWWMTAGRLLPVDLAARATREANLQARFRRALIYSDPARNDQHAVVAPVDRGYALIELGDTRDFLEMFAGIDPAGLNEDELYAYLQAVRLLDGDERERLVQHAISADDPAVRRRREAVRTLADLVHQTFVGGGEAVATRLRALTFSGQLSPGNRAMAFSALSAALSSAARPVQAVQASEFALESLLDSSDPLCAFQLDATREVLISALVAALDVEGAQSALEAYSAGPFGTGGGRLSMAMRAYVLMQRGSIRSALVCAQQFLNDLGPHDPHHLRGWVESMAAGCLVHLGRTTEALVALEAAAQHPSRMPESDLGRRITMAAARDALAEPEEALEILGAVIDEAYGRGLLLMQISAAGAGVLIGGPPQLPRLLDVVDDLVDPAGVPELWQRFARAARAYDIASIVELAVELEAKGARLMAAGIAQFVLDMARRATDLDDATRAHLAGLADLADPTHEPSV